MYEYVTRSSWGARFSPDRAIPINQRTEQLVHHTVVGSMPHSDCAAYLRTIERQHHGQWGYSVGYNELVCQHLVFFEGCGRDRRGQHCPNHNTYGLGLAYMGDGREALPTGLIAALRWRWDVNSNSAGRRLWLYPHRRFRATNCPGDVLVVEVERGLVVPAQPPVPVPAPLPPETPDMTVQKNPVLARGSNGHYVRILQGLLHAHAEDLVVYMCAATNVPLQDFVDGNFGELTAFVLVEWQRRTGALAPDGVCGPATWRWLCGEA